MAAGDRGELAELGDLPHDWHDGSPEEQEAHGNFFEPDDDRDHDGQLEFLDPAAPHTNRILSEAERSHLAHVDPEGCACALRGGGLQK